MTFIKGDSPLLPKVKSSFGGRLIRAKILGENQQMFSKKQVLQELKPYMQLNATVVKKLK